MPPGRQLACLGGPSKTEKSDQCDGDWHRQEASQMADALQQSGFTDEEITIMIVANSRLLAGPEAQDGTR